MSNNTPPPSWHDRLGLGHHDLLRPAASYMTEPAGSPEAHALIGAALDLAVSLRAIAQELHTIAQDIPPARLGGY